jgi:hypothetical protein
MPLNRPTQIELLDAVESYLRQPVEDAKADGFYRRVAANVLGIVQREMLQANDFMAQEQALLSGLFNDLPNESKREYRELNHLLCEKIQQGVIGFNTKLTSTLLEIAQQKLAIDNPRHIV